MRAGSQFKSPLPSLSNRCTVDAQASTDREANGGFFTSEMGRFYDPAWKHGKAFWKHPQDERHEPDTGRANGLSRAFPSLPCRRMAQYRSLARTPHRLHSLDGPWIAAVDPHTSKPAAHSCTARMLLGRKLAKVRATQPYSDITTPALEMSTVGGIPREDFR